MQVTKIIDIQSERTGVSRRLVTTQELQREIDYWRSYKILQKMLENRMISDAEFTKINALNRQTFSPYLARLMA